MAKWTKANYPVHVRLVESAGIAFKEYLIMGVALPAALSVESTMERGVQIPPDMRVNQANIAFVKSNNKSNKAKLTAMFAEFQQLMIGHK